VVVLSVMRCIGRRVHERAGRTHRQRH
jgi:hypothetical protein